MTEPPRSRLLRRAVIAGGLALAAVLGFVAVWIPRQPPGGLARYVSPSLDARGTRVECLRPAGWELKGFDARGRDRCLTVGPTDRLAPLRRRLPDPFLRWLPGPELGQITLIVQEVALPGKLRLDNSRVRVYPHGFTEYAVRHILSDDGRYMVTVTYSRSRVPDAQAFSRTYRHVTASLKVAAGRP